MPSAHTNHCSVSMRCLHCLQNPVNPKRITKHSGLERVMVQNSDIWFMLGFQSFTVYVNKISTFFMILFLGNHKNLIRVYNKMIDIDNISHRIFALVIWIFGSKVMVNLVASLWISLVWMTDLPLVWQLKEVLRRIDLEQHNTIWVKVPVYQL